MYRLIILLLLMGPMAGGAFAGMKDPTKPPAGMATAGYSNSRSVGQPSTLRLQQILLQGSASQVVINGKALRQGEKIRGYTVGKISANQVELNRGEQSVRLTLFNAVKQMSK